MTVHTFYQSYTQARIMHLSTTKPTCSASKPHGRHNGSMHMIRCAGMMIRTKHRQLASSIMLCGPNMLGYSHRVSQTCHHLRPVPCTSQCRSAIHNVDHGTRSALSLQSWLEHFQLNQRPSDNGKCRLETKRQTKRQTKRHFLDALHGAEMFFHTDGPLL